MRLTIMDNTLSLTSRHFHLLTAWFSPSFPIGAYTYSHGLEWEIEQQKISTLNDLTLWIHGVIKNGSGWVDAVLLRRAYEATENEIIKINDLALSLSPTFERRLETSAQGNAFLKTILEAWVCCQDKHSSPLPDDVAYPVAVGWVAKTHDVPLGPTITGYLHSIVANLVSAGIRLIPLGQTDGQRCLNSLIPVIEDTTRSTLKKDKVYLGSMSFMADIASARHETLHSRLFRS